MPLTKWLNRQIALLEKQILQSDVFLNARPCSTGELRELKRIIVIRSFLEQELSRRGAGRKARAVAPAAPELALASSKG